MPSKSIEDSYKLPLRSVFHQRALLYPSVTRPWILKLSEISVKGKLLHTRKYDTVNLFTSYRASMTKKARDMTKRHGGLSSFILDIQVAGKNKDKIFVASYNSLYYLRFCFESRRLISKSKIDNYLKHLDSNFHNFGCMSVSSNGNYVFLVETRIDSDQNSALHVFNLRWKRHLQKVLVFDFYAEALPSIRGLLCYRWMLKRYMILFGYTSEDYAKFVTLYFDKEENEVFELQHLRKEVGLNFPAKAQLVVEMKEGGVTGTQKHKEFLIHVVGRRGEIFEVLYT